MIAVCFILVFFCLSLLRSSLSIDEATIWPDAVEKSPNKGRPHNNLGHGYRLAHKPAEAMKHFERALELDPNHANLATLYANDHRTEEAVAIFRRTLFLNPNHLSAHYDPAMNLYQPGLTYDAAQEYTCNVLRRAMRPFLRDRCGADPEQGNRWAVTDIDAVICLPAFCIGRRANISESRR